MSTSSGSGYIVHADQCEIDLKNRYFAALLAFLIPGAGHFYQGRTNKAYLFTVCILGLFFFGLYLGKGRVVYASTAAEDFRILHFPAQVCVGLPALPAVYHFATGKKMSQSAPENDFETQTTPNGNGRSSWRPLEIGRNSLNGIIMPLQASNSVLSLPQWPDF